MASKYKEGDGLEQLQYSDQITSTGTSYGDIRFRKSRIDYKDPDPIYDLRGYEYKNRKSTRSLFRVSRGDLLNLIILILVAFIVRLYRLDQPTSVVFDEVHFGGFATKYMRGRFFMDVHPPLAKLLITLAGILGGFDGRFDFKEIGKDYLEPKVPYVAMRLLPAMLGIFLIPISYLTIRLSGFSGAASFLVAALIIFENGLVTQSRFILLDAPLIAFTGFTVLMWVKFHNEQTRPFKFWWWVWLAMTGVGLGLTVSCKWVGLFTIAHIGLSTIKGLWELLGDLRITPIQWMRHFFARALCLIVIPISLYCFFFVIHFAILQNGGDGDGFMSSEFQHTLRGHDMNDMPIDVAFNSQITIRHVNTQGGYLHSHKHNYPGGSTQQQITLYPHKDHNNLWILQNETNLAVNETNPIWVYDGDVIRLEHNSTHRRLHSHDVRPPVTDADFQNEVSAYGYEGFDGDANDFWRVIIVDHDKSDPESKLRLRTLHTKFRLQHVITGCFLFSHSVKLPDWGFDQQEVTCAKGGSLSNSIWYIETNFHSNIPEDAEKVNYEKPGFFAKLFELNKVMWNTNSGLTDTHPYQSNPSSWVFMKSGINFWSKDHRQVFLIGNPLTWWSSAFALIVFVFAKSIILLRAKRGYNDNNAIKEHYESNAGFFFIGWCCHYFPFFLMKRQLFLHHYFPALYYAILLIGIGFDLVTIRLKTRNRYIVAVMFLFVAIYVFSLFSPLAYGNPWTKKECHGVKWLNTWDFDCKHNFDSYEQFYKESSETLSVSKTDDGSLPLDINSNELPAEILTKENEIEQKMNDTIVNNNDVPVDPVETHNEKVRVDNDGERAINI
ncbi:glycosyltransferase family 39 protein [Rhizophagus diaphanus]|nr:glycosyltransferase family 39 protein [Rhizophagus diaphanus] [Rhizophagus sp. MUCL 43196]